MFQLVPKLASTHNKLTLVTVHLCPKNACLRMLTQQKLLTPSEYCAIGRISWKPILPQPNWPQQSMFVTWCHNHFKCCTASKLKPLFWKSHAAPKHVLCGSQQSFNKTNSVASPKIWQEAKNLGGQTVNTIFFGIPPLKARNNYMF